MAAVASAGTTATASRRVSSGRAVTTPGGTCGQRATKPSPFRTGAAVTPYSSVRLGSLVQSISSGALSVRAGALISWSASARPGRTGLRPSAGGGTSASASVRKFRVAWR